jgi:hypothetical protein
MTFKNKSKSISNKRMVLYIDNNNFNTKTKREEYIINKRTIIK